jgi:hypothetical protein
VGLPQNFFPGERRFTGAKCIPQSRGSAVWTLHPAVR